MLEKIALMESQVIRALLVAIVGLIGMVLSYFGVDEALFSERAAKLVDAIMLLLTAGSVFYAAYARATKPTPPLTDAAEQKTRELRAKQIVSNAVPMLLAGIATLMVLGLAGCAVLAPAKSFDDRLAYAYGVHTAVQSAAANSVRARELSSTDAREVLKLADESRTVLDGARLASQAGDAQGAEGKLVLATNVLIQLQTYLRERAP